MADSNTTETPVNPGEKRQRRPQGPARDPGQPPTRFDPAIAPVPDVGAFIDCVKDTVLDTALAYVRAGAYVHPCKATKEPLTPHGFHDGTIDEATIREWFTKWPHAEIGWALPTAVVVLDLDNKPGRNGKRALVEKSMAPLAAKTSAVTPSGGEHHFYLADNIAYRNCNDEVAVGVDVKTGGGYVILPAPGNGRRWSSCAALTPLPDDLKELLGVAVRIDEPEESAGPAKAYRGRTPFETNRLNELLDTIRFARQGERETVRHRACFIAGQYIAGGAFAAGQTENALAEATQRNSDKFKTLDAIMKAVRKSIARGQKFPRYAPGDAAPAKVEMRVDGLVRMTSKGAALKVCDPFTIIGRTEQLGLVIRIGDNGKPLLVAAADLHAPQARSTLAVRLTQAGLSVGPGAADHEALVRYLIDCDRAQLPTFHTLDKRGWHQLGGKLAFVHDEGVIGAAADSVLLDLGEPYLARRGTLKEWNERVARPHRQDRLIVFAISCALAGPLLFPLGQDSFGVHGHGPSSAGKTSAGRAALSVFTAPVSGMRQWTATTNAIESELQDANDSFELRDELTTVNVWTAREIIYRGFTGRGRSRLTRDAKRKQPITWRTIMFSTGEPSLDDILREAKGDRRGHLGGQDVRLMSLRVDKERLPHGVFETVKTVEEGEQAEQRLRQATDECHGVAGWAFIERLVQELQAQGTFKATALARLTEATAVIIGDHKVGEEARRVARHLAQIALAGELATEWRIVDWEAGAATQATATVFNWWIEDRGDGKTSRGQLEVVDILKRSLAIDRARWQPTESPFALPRVPHERLGFIDTDKDEVWLPGESMRLLFDVNASVAPKALKDADLIKRWDAGMQAQCSPPGEKRRRFYVLSLTKLTGDGSDEDKIPPKPRTLDEARRYCGAAWSIFEEELDWAARLDPCRRPRMQTLRLALGLIEDVELGIASSAWRTIDAFIHAGIVEDAAA